MRVENQKDILHICSDNVTSILQKIRSEEANHEFITMRSILDLAENGNEEAFQIILRLFDDPLSGIGYTIATDIFEKKFVSQSMVATLSKIEEVEEALIEIENGDNVDRIILEGTGMKKY